MKYNFIIHARYKQLKDRGNVHVLNSPSLTCSPLTEQEREFYDIDAKGGVTLAVVKNPDDTLSWAVSKCNMKDSYNKRIGRNKAIGRAIQNGIRTKDIPLKML